MTKKLLPPPSSNQIHFQMRLDFNTFVITGPSTYTSSETLILNGGVATGGAAANYASTCATDIFTITNASNLPELCGMLTYVRQVNSAKN